MNSGQNTTRVSLSSVQVPTPESYVRQEEVLQYNNLAIPRQADPRQLRRAIENLHMASPASVLQIQ